MTFEKSQKQFAQAAWPINFANDIEAPKDPLRRFEPSTELTWALGGNNLTRLEARAACADKGKSFRVMRAQEWKHAERWLKVSAIGAAITAGSDGQKSIWLEEYHNRGHEAQFQYVTTSAQGSEYITSIVKSQQYIDEGKSSAVDTVGGSTAKISVICISTERLEE